MEMTVRRGAAIGEALPGEMTIDGRHACSTLERVAVAIPPGRYQVTLYPSPHFQRNMPLLVDVPGRAYIEIHFGNYPDESDGCILVGNPSDPTTGDVFNSRKTFDALYAAIESAVEGEGCWITIA
jgi:hypothetical protein